MRTTFLTIAALAVSTFSLATAASADNACEREMQAASTKYGVPLGVLYAVGLTESGRTDSLRPYAMNIAGTAYFGPDLPTALARFEEEQARGVTLIDIGCMQINHHFHGQEFSSVAEMFEPHANVDYAARFLKTLRKQEGSWTLAVARYNAGPNNNPAQKKYVCAVITNMVASGFGSWTPEASAFCKG